uniref:Proline-rich receptor-like protein kinase PERK2 n=1 Tax=Rhizophora mucronata TaxID=61149 RepID=A0A2P2JGG4_RHIMU
MLAKDRAMQKAKILRNFKEAIEY